MRRPEHTVRDELWRRVRADSAVRALSEALTRGDPVLTLSGLYASGAKSFLIALLGELLRASDDARRALLFVSAEEDVGAMREEVLFFLSLLREDPLSAYALIALPAPDVSPFDGLSPHPGLAQKRAAALADLVRARTADTRVIVLADARALPMRLPAHEEIARLDLHLVPGQEIAPEDLAAFLHAAGYVREDPVREVGEFSWRGGILDVYPPSEPEPVRVEFVGDAIESLRSFDPESQRSRATRTHARIVSLREIVLERDELKRWAERAEEEWPDSRFAYDRKQLHMAAQTGELPHGWEFLAPLTRVHQTTLWDLLPSGSKPALLVIDDAPRFFSQLEQFWEAMCQRYERAQENGRLVLPPDRYFLSPAEISARMNAHPRIELHPLGRALTLGPSDEDLPREISLRALAHRGISRAAADPVASALASTPGTVTFLTARTKALADHLLKLLAEREISADLWDPSLALPSNAPRWPVFVLVGPLRRGFDLPSLALSFFTQQDLLGEEPESPPPSPGRERARALFLSDFKDLKPGDYVVHVDHGIGQFEGLVQLVTSEGIPHDFLLLRYADDARLYVPVERLDLVQKYTGTDGSPPRVDRLGGTAWPRAKARALRAMRNMAEELLKLHAERTLIPGHAFSPDTSWQAEFEAGFEYDLTPDQARALQEIKRDMERPIPMDRLLCGDVGFGKTEVAMRAAFKAVMDGKQVAVLVPTTVLAEQHYRTFTQRFAPFPITIAQLSRFCSRAEIRRTLQGLEEGTVDIVIGTHRLLSRDVRFRDLGLVIIDEEQRFGVAHKERLKQLRRRVDVLTLTATPIPRTLYMALTGLRDLSVIQTPPPDRLAVQTLIVPFSPAIIRHAIEHELQRDGQVFFVHNEIETIHEIAHLIRQLVPAARLGVAHGRLSERELERTMLRFVRQELNVLVTTTIIENGVDIPQANTILINHAERFGLADLYQLRGRVGRSTRLAYAYLLIPPESTLSSIAHQRLAALKEFSDLGSGFRLAALDLELRGAGNLLGPEQSGHINALGFELYCHLLERTIRELKGEPIEEEITPQIALGIPIRIPDAYIPDMGQRLQVYKRLASARTEAKLAALRQELMDRYGPLPPPVEHLLLFGSIRNAAMAVRARAIQREGSHILIRFADAAHLDPERLTRFCATYPSAHLSADTLSYHLDAPSETEWLRRVRDSLLLLCPET